MKSHKPHSPLITDSFSISSSPTAKNESICALVFESIDIVSNIVSLADESNVITEIFESDKIGRDS